MSDDILRGAKGTTLTMRLGNKATVSFRSSKAEMVEAVLARSGLYDPDTAALIEALFDVFTENLKLEVSIVELPGQ